MLRYLLSPIYEKNETKSSYVQPHGTFMIQFDKDLMFIKAQATSLIHFYLGSCTMKYDDMTVNCFQEPVIIPSSMKFKNHQENQHTVNISSPDTVITGPSPFNFTSILVFYSL